MRWVVSCGSTSFPWLVFFFGALPWFTSIRENGCDKGAHQSYLGAEINTLVNPNCFQPCQCCSCQCYPAEYLRLGTLIRYNWAQVFEACDCLNLLFIHFDLCVDATGVVVISSVFSALISRHCSLAGSKRNKPEFSIKCLIWTALQSRSVTTVLGSMRQRYGWRAIH